MENWGNNPQENPLLHAMRKQHHDNIVNHLLAHNIDADAAPNPLSLASQWGMAQRGLNMGQSYMGAMPLSGEGWLGQF